MVEDIIRLTLPFANTWEHVQGPGGNTSVKENGQMLIKASGYTFKNITDSIGLVWVENAEASNKIAESCGDNSHESMPITIIKSIPEGLRPSMEFEFHAVLGKYVLHTHSVYVNVVTCSTETQSILNAIFPDIPFVLIPYIMPGHPLAALIYKKNSVRETAGIYFLKNHGIIIHGNSIEEIHSLYYLVQQRIIDFFALHKVNTSPLDRSFSFGEVSYGLDRMIIADVHDRVIVPDQSIFFRDKISGNDPSAPVYFDTEKRQITISGSDKFAEAAVSMLRMIYYVISNHQRLALVSEFISQDELNILSGLSSEKYRKSIL